MFPVLGIRLLRLRIKSKPLCSTNAVCGTVGNSYYF